MSMLCEEVAVVEVDIARSLCVVLGPKLGGHGAHARALDCWLPAKEGIISTMIGSITTNCPRTPCQYDWIPWVSLELGV